MFKNKKLNLGLFIIFSILTAGFFFYWELFCKTGACTYQLRNDFIRPLAQASVYLGVVFAIFLLLPAKYFNAWFKYVFIWAFPLSFVLVETLPVETGWLTISKTDIVQLLGMIFGAVTILFAAVQWFRSKK